MIIGKIVYDEGHRVEGVDEEETDEHQALRIGFEDVPPRYYDPKEMTNIYTPTPRTHHTLCPHSDFGMIPTKSIRIISGSILYLWTYMKAVRFNVRRFITPKVSSGCPCDSSRR